MEENNRKQVPDATGAEETMDFKQNEDRQDPKVEPTGASSTPPNTPITIPKNPWASRSTFNTPSKEITNLLSIMSQQESEVNVQSETEEECMIRLAIEASLEDAKGISSTCSDKIESTDQKVAAPATKINATAAFAIDDDMDEDMKLAIRLSMADTNANANAFSVGGGDGKISYQENDLDKKLPALDVSDGKPSATRSGIRWEGDAKPPPSVAAAAVAPTRTPAASSFITIEEEEAIARAILEADDAEHAHSLNLAMEMQAEEDRHFARIRIDQVRNNSSRSSIRTVTKSEFEDYRLKPAAAAAGQSENQRQLWGQGDYEYHNAQYGHGHEMQEFEDSYHVSESSSGYQINSSTPSKTWSRLDKNTILGPNNEVRTKHDVMLKNQANAERLLGGKSSEAKQGGSLSVSDTAYNSLNQSLKVSMKRGMVKGVERSGTGRAENMNEKTRGGAMDGNVRLVITKAINTGLIQHCNGVVKEGKEAVVYHAEGGLQSDGFDVAVKVFKRIQEFKGRGAYMDGDPRYYGQKFRNADQRQQIELWAEKEYRNLLRASRAGVAVPTPLMQKDNVLFMRFLGEGGWPAAQLREVEINKGSKKWTALYCQTLVAIRRLYHCARLIHADLSEYNILVCPMSQVENAMDKSEEAKDSLQVVLIDFGQAVERNHPAALDLLRRDLSIVRSFFAKKDIVALSDEECEKFIVREVEIEEEDDEEDDDDQDPELIDEESASEEGNNDNVDDDENDGAPEEWRHSIKGWDEAKDLDWLESRLDQLKKT